MLVFMQSPSLEFFHRNLGSCIRRQERNDFSLMGLLRARIRKRLRSPAVDTKESVPPAPAYVVGRADTIQFLSYRPVRLHRLAESIPWNRLLDSLNVYKFGFWIATILLQLVSDMFSALVQTIRGENCIAYTANSMRCYFWPFRSL